MISNVDPTVTTFSPIKCDPLVLESTFALPIYRPPVANEFNAIKDFYLSNKAKGMHSVVAYRWEKRSVCSWIK